MTAQQMRRERAAAEARIRETLATLQSRTGLSVRSVDVEVLDATTPADLYRMRWSTVVGSVHIDLGV